MKLHGLPRRRRLSEPRAIRAVFSGGRYHRLGLLHAKSLASGGGETRFLVSIKKSVGSAPERNRLKRLVRESVRLHPLDLPAPHDVCLIVPARPARAPTLADIDRDLRLLERRLSGTGSP